MGQTPQVPVPFCWRKPLDGMFVLNSILLGAGLAMDAFSVSIANALAEPRMGRRKMGAVAGTYALFQFAMPVIGWICVHTIVNRFSSFRKFIPWIALILLAFIGGKMIAEGLKGRGGDDEEGVVLTAGVLAAQGIATSIDALSVGFTIAEYAVHEALISAAIIAAVTFAICAVGLRIGKMIGTRAGNKAQIVGGLILIAIGLEIFFR